MRAWLIVAAWWIQGAFDRIRGMHLTTDPACVQHRAPRRGSMLDRAARGLECEPCMVRRAFGLIPDRTDGSDDGFGPGVMPEGAKRIPSAVTNRTAGLEGIAFGRVHAVHGICWCGAMHSAEPIPSTPTGDVPASITRQNGPRSPQADRNSC